MGFFSRTSSNAESDSAEVPAITQERLKKLFDAENWRYFIDNEGDLGGMWDSNHFYFLLRGDMKEILHITARWHGTIAFEKLELVREFINAWNRDKLWPKTYHRINDEGRIMICAEHSTDFEFGATDEQLMQSVNCALGTSTSFFEACETEFGN